jgi:hypothetical protein
MLLTEIFAKVRNVGSSTDPKHEITVHPDQSVYDSQFNGRADFIDVVVFPEEQAILDSLKKTNGNITKAGVEFNNFAKTTNKFGDPVLHNRNSPLTPSKYTPPAKIVAYMPYTLNKGGTPENREISKRFMNAVKQRDSKNVLASGEYEKFIDSGIQQLVNRANGAAAGKASHGVPNKQSDIIKYEKLNGILKQKGNNTVLLVTPSSQSLAEDLANKLKELLPAARAIRDVVVKNNFPKQSAYVYKRRSDSDINRASPHTGYFVPRNDPDLNPTTVEFPKGAKHTTDAVQLGPLVDFTKEFAAKYKESMKPLIKAFRGKYFETQRQLLPVLAKIFELESIQNKTPAQNMELREYKTRKTQLNNQLNDDDATGIAQSLRLLTKSDSPYANLMNHVKYIRDYIADIKKYEELFNKEMGGSGLTPAEAVMLDHFMEISMNTNNPNSFEKRYNNVLGIIDGLAVEKFDIKKQNTDWRTAKGSDSSESYGVYKLFLVKNQEEMNQIKDTDTVIIVDDNIERGTTISNIVKSIYMAGKSPKEIIAIASHYFTYDTLSPEDKVEWVRNMEGISDSDWEKMGKAAKTKYAKDAKDTFKRKFDEHSAKVTDLGDSYGNTAEKIRKNKELGAKAFKINPSDIKSPKDLPNL